MGLGTDVTDVRWQSLSVDKSISLEGIVWGGGCADRRKERLRAGKSLRGLQSRWQGLRAWSEIEALGVRSLRIGE